MASHMGILTGIAIVIAVISLKNGAFFTWLLILLGWGFLFNAEVPLTHDKVFLDKISPNG